MARGSTVLSVSVRECRNARSPRSDTPLCFVRVEHGARVLGEGGKATCGGEGAMNGAVEVSIECEASQRETIDTLIQNPVLVSLLEVLPKDKKSKEEKTAELGHVTLDLLPLLLGERKIELTLTLQGGDAENAEIDVVVTTSQDILTEEQREESNILFLRIRSLHALPSSWHTHPSLITLSTPHPIPGAPISLPGAPIKKAESGDGHAHWRWPGGRGEGVRGERWAVEDESGDLRGVEEIPFRQSAECKQPCVDWSVELRTWLPPSSPLSLLTTLTQSPLWPVEIIKCTTAQTGKGKTKEEDTLTSHHGVAYLNLSPLLYPGTARVAGAFTVHPFSEADVVAKIGRDYSSLLVSSPTPPTKKTLPGGAGGKSLRRMDSILKLRSGSIVSQASEDKGGGGAGGGGGEGGEKTASLSYDEEKTDTREGVVYEEARSYLWAELELHHPLVPKRSASVLAERVSEYVPKRPAVKRREGGAERALAVLHTQVAAISRSLLGEYREMLGGEGENGQSTMEDRQRQLLSHLNSSGKYHTFKEQLKHSVVGLVRERYGNKSGFRDSAHCHTFLSHLYTYLIDQLHTSINQGVTLTDPPETTPTPVDFDLLKHYAQEAEDFLDYQLAEKYYKERVSCADHVPQYWYDYSVFCLLIGQLDKAEQCLKEAIALDQKMIPALLLYGMLNCIGERYEEGSEFMELATTFDPTNTTAWCIRGLFYEQQTDRVMEEMCCGEAVRLCRGEEEKTYITSSTTRQPPAGRAEAAAGRVSNRTGEEGEIGDVPSKTEPQTNAGEVSTVLSTSPDDENTTGQDTATTVHVDEEGGEEQTASRVELQSEAPPTSEALPTAEAPVVGVEGRGREDLQSTAFLQTASFLLDVHALKFAEMALAHIQASLSPPPSSPSPPPSLYHIHEARLHLQRSDPVRAQASLKAALQVDVQSSWAWSLLGHTHFLLGEFPQAREAYERCLLLKTPPPNLHSVHLHLAHIHLSDKRYSAVKEVCLRACRNTPSGATWRGVGVACYHLGDLGEAEAALCEANTLNNHDPLTWAYLTLLCLKTGRPVEAEQALKFAVKTGLGAELEVVQEIRQEMMSHAQDSAHQHIPHLLTQLT